MSNIFYLKIQRKFKSEIQDNSNALKYIEKFVLANKGENVEINSNQLNFSMSFLGWSWDYFALIDRGNFIIENNHIIFKFSIYKRLIVILILISLILYQTKNYLAGIPFVLVIIINCVTAIVRYKKMLNTMVNELK